MIKIELKQEVGTSRDPAKVLVFEDSILIAEVIATIDQEQGADGGYYHVVKLRKIE